MQDSVRAGDSAEAPACTRLLQNEESMPTLSDEMKAFIVKRLACFDTPSQVAAAVKANFDIEIARQHVYAYDPNSSERISPRWRELHAATRAAFLRDAAEIGIAHRTVRLRMLDRMTRNAEAHNYFALAAALMEQAARECGGFYESRKGSEPRPPAITAAALTAPAITAPAVTAPALTALAITGPAPSAPENPAAAVPAAR